MLIALRISFLLMIFIEIGLVSYVFAKKSKSTQVVNTFLIFLIINAIWFFAQLLVISPLFEASNIIYILKFKIFFWTLPLMVYALFILSITNTNLHKFMHGFIAIQLIAFTYAATENNIIIPVLTEYGFYHYKTNWFSKLLPSLNAVPMVIIYFVLIKKYDRNSSYIKSYLSLFLLSFMSFLVIPISHMNRLTLSFAVPVWSFIISIVTFLIVKRVFLSIDYEEFTNELFSNIQDAVLITNKQDQIIVTNKLADHIISKTIDMDILFLKPSDIFEHYNQETDYKNKRFKFKEKEEEVLISQSILSNKETNFKAIIVIKDLSSERLLEEEMVRNQKLQSISVFVGGIAHDFGNILTAILGNNTYLKIILENEETEAPAILQNTEEIILRAKGLTKQLMDYTKTNEDNKKSIVSMDKIIQSTLSLALSGSHIKINTKIDDNLYKIYGNKVQLEQVFNNLFINAKQAMQDHGKLTVKVRRILIENQYIQFIKPGKYLEIIVKDTGEGIAKDKLHKIFTPYFTTKKTGNGLGLAIVSSIVKNHGGYITVESQLNKGTSFILYLPATAEDSKPSKPKKKTKSLKPLSQVPSKKETIILLDDEDMILDIAEKILIKLNYHVISMKTGEDVLDFTQKHKEQNIHAFILDLTIEGGMGGKEIAFQLQKDFPNSKIIVSSGYANKDEVLYFEKYGFTDKLIKPYTIEDIKQTLGRKDAKDT